MMNELLSLLGTLAPSLIYLLLGAGAALENVVPPVPADTFVLLGGFLAAMGRAEPWTVFLVTWGANVGSALAVYWGGHRLGRPFFETGWGRYLLNPSQFARIVRFYDRWGHLAIFITRFLPGLRAVVPGFAGVTHQPILWVAIPLTTASAIWYGTLVWLGFTAGRNLGRIQGWLEGANLALLALAILVGGLVGLWWIRTRRQRADDPSQGTIPASPEGPTDPGGSGLGD
jgi:membrane protein DedA with SNARE-associated domain